MAESFIRFEDNSTATLEEMKKRIELAMDAIGLTAEKHAKANCPVDTGRLRNSITYATAKTHSDGEAPAEGKDYKMHGTPKESTVYIGTNVEYAGVVELRDVTHKTGKAHFLRDAISTHGTEYKDLLKTALSD